MPCSPPRACCATWRSRRGRSPACSPISRRPSRPRRSGSIARTSASSRSWSVRRSTSPPGIPCRRWTAYASPSPTGGGCCARRTPNRSWSCDSRRAVSPRSRRTGPKWRAGSVQLPRRLGDLEIVEAVPQRVLLGGTITSGLVFGFLLALGTGDWWMAARLAAHPPRFGIADPLLHRDLGYYVGQLPWLARVQGLLLLASVTGTVLVALLYFGMGSLRFRHWSPQASAHARAHLGLALAATALALAWGAVLDPAETVAGLHGALERGVRDVRLPGAALVAALAIAATVASFVWALRDKPTFLVASWGALLGVALLVYLVIPAVWRGRGSDAEAGFLTERTQFERLAFGAEALAQGPPPAWPTPDAAAMADRKS